MTRMKQWTVCRLMKRFELLVLRRGKGPRLKDRHPKPAFGSPSDFSCIYTLHFPLDANETSGRLHQSELKLRVGPACEQALRPNNIPLLSLLDVVIYLWQ
jgi:hypothetical protein